MARDIAREIRASGASVLPVLEKLCGTPGADARLVEYAVARCLVMSQHGGLALQGEPMVKTNPAQRKWLASDELLLRTLKALETQGPAANKQAAAESPAGLPAAGRPHRALLVDFLADAVRKGTSALTVDELVKQWRSVSGSAVQGAADNATNFKDLRAHLLLRLEVDRRLK